MNPKQPQTVIPQEQRQPCEVWTRVMGYHRPVASFNTGKKSEYAERTLVFGKSKSIQGENIAHGLSPAPSGTLVAGGGFTPAETGKQTSAV